MTIRFVTAFVDTSGTPVTGLSATIDIFRLSDDTQVVTAGAMNEVALGLYSYDFAEDPAEDYAWRADGTASANPRYAFGSHSGRAADALLNDVPDILTDTAAMQPLVDVATSTRAAPGDAMALTAGGVDDIWDEPIAGHLTAGSTGEALDDASGSVISQQDVRDAMKLAPTAGAPAAGSVDQELDDILADTGAIEPLATANLDAAVSSRATQADILSDATPFAGANVDAAISSRSSHTAVDVDTQLSGAHGAGSWATATGFATPGDAMALTAAAVDDVWDELLAGHLGVGSVGEALSDALTAAQAVDGRLPSDPADESLQQAAHTATQALITALNDLSIADVQTALTNQGYTAARALLLDNLDAAISTVLTNIAALNDLDIADVQTALTNQGYTVARATLIDNLDVAITTRTAPGDAMALTTAAEDAVVDAVWQETLAGVHDAEGTAGGALVAAAAQGLENTIDDEFNYAGTAPPGQPVSCRRRVFTSADYATASPGSADDADNERMRFQCTFVWSGSNPTDTLVSASFEREL